MRKYVAIGTLAAMALGAQTAAAEGFSYNNIEGQYAFMDIEGFDLDGFGVSGSGELTSNLFGFGGLANLDVEGGGSIDTLNLGLGVNWAIGDNADLIGGASFERIKFLGSSESGWGIMGGVRGRVAESLELTASLKYSDVGDVENVLTWDVGARWYFTPNFAAGANYTSMDFDDLGVKADGFIVSLRYDFGDRL
jgi:hypothetical protein